MNVHLSGAEVISKVKVDNRQTDIHDKTLASRRLTRKYFAV